VLVDFPEFAKRHPRTARAIVRAVVRVRIALPEELRDPQWARLLTCAGVREDRRKARAVAREVYSDLIGLEDSCRRIGGDGWQPRMTVEQRFPHGENDVEPLVLEVCDAASAEATPFSILWSRFVGELELSV
jgi:hypothetical protein